MTITLQVLTDDGFDSNQVYSQTAACTASENNRTATGFSIFDPISLGAVRFVGTGLTYGEDKLPTGGEITEIVFEGLGGNLAHLTGLASSGADVGDAILAARAFDFAPMRELFKGQNEVMIGGPGSDTFSPLIFDETLTYDFRPGDGNDVVQLDINTGNVFADGGEGHNKLVLFTTFNGSGFNFDLSKVTPQRGTFTLLNFQDVDASAGDDQITGTDGENRLDGNFGDDKLVGRDGDDELIGSGGKDTLQGGAGADLLQGGEGIDLLDGGIGSDTGDWSDRFDTISVQLKGASAATVFVGGIAQDTVQGVENIVGGIGKDTLTGDGLANWLEGAGAQDALDGGAGNDILMGGADADDLTGGAGIDTADYSDMATSVIASLTGATEFVVKIGGVDQDTITLFENIIGGSGDDTFTGADGLANKFIGNAGKDTLNGDAGNDVLIGGAGNDSLNGGTGVDTADYSEKTDAVSVTLVGSALAIVKVGGINEDRLRSVENVTGGTGNDKLNGDGAANALAGNSGADTLIGKAGADVLSGGDGDDAVKGGADADVLDGGAGIDTADFSDKTPAVLVTLKGAAFSIVTVNGGAEDKIKAFENIATGSGSDSITGDGSDNGLTGNGGADTLVGGAGNDTLTGGDGNDRMIGGAGVDRLAGGAGASVFVYTALSDSGIGPGLRDSIAGFAAGNKIDVSAIDAIAGGANNAFVLDAGGTFVAGEIKQTKSGANLILDFNADADSASEMQIAIIGRATFLAAGDFVL